MPKVSYALEENGPKRLELAGKWGWNDLQISLDGHPIGTVANQRELKEGRQFVLPDGSLLHVQLVQNVLQPELRVHRNDRPVPGSPSDPFQRLKLASGWLYVVGGMTMLLGIIAGMWDVPQLQRMGLGYEAATGSVIYLILAYFVGRRSSIALGLAVALLILDAMLGLAAGAAGGNPQIGSLIVRLFIIGTLCQGFGALRTLKSQTA